MALQPLSDDTILEVEQRQIERWRKMTPAEKAAIVTGLTQATFELARAGVRRRHPDASERERKLRLAIAILGAELAMTVYPEIATLERT